MEGSDVVSGSELDIEDECSGGERGGKNGNWNVVGNRKRKKKWNQLSGSESERERQQEKRKKEEFKVMISFLSDNMNALNPLKITKAIKEDQTCKNVTEWKVATFL